MIDVTEGTGYRFANKDYVDEFGNIELICPDFDITKYGDDIARRKHIIKQIFANDKDLVHFLNNPHLNEEEPDTYIDENILSYLKINPTQDETLNFVCCEIDDLSTSSYNNAMKRQVLTVMCMVYQEDLPTEVHIERTDVLGYIVKDLLNWSNVLGMQLKLFYNASSIVDARYYCRTLKFEMNTINDTPKNNYNHRGEDVPLGNGTTNQYGYRCY